MREGRRGSPAVRARAGGEKRRALHAGHDRPPYEAGDEGGGSAHDSGALLCGGSLFAKNRPRNVRAQLFAQHHLSFRAGGLLDGGAMLGWQSPIRVQPRPYMPTVGVAKD